VQKKITVFSIVCLLGVVFDQITKIWVQQSEAINQGGITVIPHFLSFVHAENPGAAFGLLGGMSTTWRMTIFLGFTVIAVFVIADLFRKLPPNDWFMSTTLGLILSGAIGNAIDRIYKQEVTDFIRVYTDHPPLKNWLEDHWPYMSEYPSFNIADSLLVVGVGMFLVHYLFLEERDNDEDAPPTEESPAVPETPETTAQTSEPNA